MEVVKLAHITFSRIGSAAPSIGFNSKTHRHQKFSVEVDVVDVDSLRTLIIEIAEAHGEGTGQLEPLKLERQYGATGEFVYNLQVGNTQYGSPYVVCQVRLALKAAGEYYELQQIDNHGFEPYTPTRKAILVSEQSPTTT